MDCLLLCGEAGAATGGGGANPMDMIFMFAALGVVFYFLILRPQKKEQAERQKMLKALAKGDRVMTSAGILGRVVEFHKGGDVVTVDCGHNVQIDFSRSAITTITKKVGDSEKDATDAEDESDKPERTERPKKEKKA